MGSWSELRGLLLPPGSCLGSKSEFSGCLSREPLWCAPLEWKICVDLTLSGISLFILG